MMDEKRDDENQRIGESLCQFNQIGSENSSKSINGVELKTESEMNSAGNLEIRDLELGIDQSGSTKVLLESPERVVSNEMQDRRMIAESSSNSVNGVMLETVVKINSEPNMSSSEEKGGFGSKFNEMELSDWRGNGASVVIINSDQMARVDGERRISEGNDSDLEMRKKLVENLEKKICKNEKESCVIDVKDGDENRLENSDGELVCRICHLNPEQPINEADATIKMGIAGYELIRLGCGCKDELGKAHRHCAESWFKLKGNRFCEICGQTARNVTGMWNHTFMEEWNEGRHDLSYDDSSESGGRCWRGRPFCNFLMACLVIAFVLPWFFRVNMF